MLLLCFVPGADAQTEGLPAGAVYALVALLVILSGMFSGLTLGLLGLDKMGLQIVIGGGEPEKAAKARKILPLREDGNLLLCTLLLGNVLVNSLLSVMMANLTNGFIGVALATGIITIFGEIMPQACFSRYALDVGAMSVPLVTAFKYALFIVAKPIALALDYALGEELGTIFTHAELTEMVALHVKQSAMDVETGNAITGALKYKQQKVEEAMTALDLVFMLSVDEKLTYGTISAIFKQGFSRIPVYERSRHHVVGLLYTKDLIFIDPEDATPVRNFTQIFGRPVTTVFSWTTLGECMNVFRQGRGHLALVTNVAEGEAGADNTYKLVGIITLEDIIEEILGEEIVDEYDTWNDNTHAIAAKHDETFDSARLRVLHSHSSVDDAQLPREQRDAIVAHLSANVPQLRDGPLGPVPPQAVARLVNLSSVRTLSRRAPPEAEEPAAEDVLYERGAAARSCTLVLQGRLEVLAGNEAFRSDSGPWSVLAADAMVREEGYVPDFTAYVASERVKVMTFTMKDLREAMAARPLPRASSMKRAGSGRAAFNRAMRTQSIQRLRVKVKTGEASGDESEGDELGAQEGAAAAAMGEEMGEEEGDERS